MKYDLIIIGAGPAGLSAALYGCRQGLKVAVIAADIGGQVTKALKIENYPGLPNVSGQDLINIIKRQVDRYQAKFIWKMVTEVKKSKNRFIVKTTDDQIFYGKSVIAAFGKTPKKLNVPGENQLIGKGVGYCAICDMPFFRNKTIAVVGGGNSALHSVLAAKDLAKMIYLIHRRDKFRAEETLIEKIKDLKKTGKLKIITNSIVAEIIGREKVTGLKISQDNRGLRELKVDGIFIEIGFTVDNQLIKKLVDFDKNGEIRTNLRSETKTAGLFIAGDISAEAHDQAIVAAGQGASAAISAYQYLKGDQGEKL